MREPVHAGPQPRPGIATLWSRARWLAARGQRFLILTYHRVLAAPDPLQPGEIDRAAFEQHVHVLSRHFRIRPLADTIRRARERMLEPATVCLTFDDGYADNVQEALPILQRHGAMATFFIASGYLAGRVMWNDVIIEAIRRTNGTYLDAEDLGLGSWSLEHPGARRAALKGLLNHAKYLAAAERDSAASALSRRLGVAVPKELMMTPAQVASLAHAGMQIGGHTVNHPILRTLDASTARKEIELNKRELERISEVPVEIFAYPNGRPEVDFDERDVQLVRRAGFAGAVTTHSATASDRDDCFRLPRFGPWSESATRFRLRMLSLM